MKKLLSLVLLFSICATLCACSFPSKRYLSPKITAPDTYLITYEESYSEGSTNVYSEGYDAEGNVYYNSNGTQYVYAKNPEYEMYITKYDEYTNKSGRFVKTAEKVHGENGECGMIMLYMYAKYNLKPTNCTVKSKSSETFLDRKCTAYTIVVHESASTSVTEKYTYEVIIDNETGFCLKSVCTAIDSPFDEKKTPFGFTCTEFTTTPSSFADLIK